MVGRLNMSATVAALLADALLVLHAGIVVFVVGLLPLVLLGGWHDWRWVRHRGLRLLHLSVIAGVTVQSWLGQHCPLTLWEQELRHQAGQARHAESFIAYWIGRLLYWELSWWVFVGAYTVFAVLVALAWWLVRPHPHHPR